MTGSVRLRVWFGAPLIWVLAGCVSKGDIQRVQDDVALFKAETARRDSVRAAQLNEVIRVQQRIMDSLTSSRRAVGQLRGDLASDLYNIQQQLVQLQELTGQSQQRLSELRTQLEARGEQLASAAPGDTTRPGRARRPRPTRCTKRRWHNSGEAAPPPPASACGRCFGSIPIAIELETHSTSLGKASRRRTRIQRLRTTSR